jgi:tetratricopeptide (TPR) repeat protein
LGRAFVLHGLGRLNEALTSYERTLELNPRNFAAWINKALILQSQHRNAEALECFGKVTDLDPAYSWEEWNYKGLSFLELDRPGDALCCYEQACKLNSNDSTSWYNRAITEQRLGKMQDAANSYDKFLAVAEKSYTGLKAEEKKEMEANIEYARRRLKELRKAAPSVPKSPSTASTCSRCGHNSGIPAKFCANCGKALTS